MKAISGAARGIVRRAGVMAVAAFALTAVTHDRAEALTLASPAAVPVAKYASENLIEVRHGGHGGGGFRGGGGGGYHGGGFRGYHGGFRGGGFAYRGGGYRAAHIYRGGYRYGGYRHAYHRPFYHRRHFHRRFYAPYYANYSYYPRCRIVWTYYGPRKICRYRHWHRHNYWRFNPYRNYW